MAFRLRWPTEFNHIGQGFGLNPQNYKEYGLPGHEGLDFRAPTGSKIFACADGVVSEVRMDGNTDRKKFPYGNQIRIVHRTDEGEFTTVYAHLMTIGVAPNQPVKAGDLIGIADETGNAHGAHLHLTLKRKGATAEGATPFPRDIINPTPYLDPFTVAPGTIPVPLDGLKYQADITIPDNSPMPPGRTFVKTWRVLNNGSTTWGEGYTLAFFKDEQMGAPDAVPLPPTAPGGFAEVSVTLTAPDAPGFRRSTWKAKNPAGEVFGTILFALINVTPDAVVVDTVPAVGMKRVRNGHGPLNAVIALSHHHNITNWEEIRAGGIEAIIHRATLGTDFVDERYAGRRDRAREMGFLWGAYHTGVGGDPAGQARHFLDTAQPDVQSPEATARTLLALYFEHNPNGVSMSLVEAEAFVQAIHDETGRWPVVYTGRWYIREFIGDSPSTVLAGCPLWVIYHRAAPVIPAQWLTWTLWQYSNGVDGPEPRTLRGVVHCDRNWFNGTREELEQLWGG